MHRVTWILALAALAGVLLLLHAPGEPPTAPVADRARLDGAKTPPATLAPGASWRPGTVTREHARVSISGHVRDPRGAPSSYALVTWLDGRGNVIAKTRTGARGAFSLDGPRGDGRLRIESRTADRVEADLDTQDLDGCLVQLLEGRALHGVVLTEKDREPIAGARVHMRAFGFGESTAVTDEAGAFRLAAVPVDDDFDVDFEAGSRGRTTVENVVWAEGERLVVVMPEVWTLRGRVVCARTGRFVGGSEGSVSWSGTAHDGEGAITDDEGYFTYEDITHPGELAVLSEGWQLPEGEHEWWEHGDEMVLRVVPRSTVSGTVVDEHGNPVAGAEVEVSHAWRKDPVRADASGRFAVPGVALSRHGNVVEATRGDLAGWTRVKGRPGHPLDDVELRLERKATVTGTVLDERGRPLACAEVHVWWTDDRFSRVEWDWTDDAGRFSFTGIEPGGCSVEAEAAGYQNVERCHQLPPGATDIGEITLQPLLWREVRVVDEDGAPVPSAWWRSRPYASFREHPVSDDGTFRFGTTPDGTFGDLVVGAPEFMERTFEKEALPAEGPFVVVLRRAHVVEGRLLDLDGRPVRGANVVCHGARYVSSFWDTRTDMAGRFRVKVGALGPYEIDVRSHHYFPPDVRIEADAGPVDVYAHPPCSIGGRVVGQTGLGIANACVYIGGGWEKKDKVVWADAEGQFRIDGRMGRTFDVTVFCDDESLAFRPHREVPANTEDLLIRAERAWTITGTVIWSDGTPAVGVDVEATPVGHTASWDIEETDEDGSFRFTGLPTGPYDLDVWTSIEVDGEDEDDLEYSAEMKRVQAGTCNVRLLLR